MFMQMAKKTEENTSRPLVESGTKPSLQSETGITIKFEKGAKLGGTFRHAC